MRQTALKVPGKARRGVKVFDVSGSFGRFFLGVWICMDGVEQFLRDFFLLTVTHAHRVRH